MYRFDALDSLICHDLYPACQIEPSHKSGVRYLSSSIFSWLRRPDRGDRHKDHFASNMAVD